MLHFDVLIDVFTYLERNEIEKSEYVSKIWRNVIRSGKVSRALAQRRRLQKLLICPVRYLLNYFEVALFLELCESKN